MSSVWNRAIRIGWAGDSRCLYFSSQGCSVARPTIANYKTKAGNVGQLLFSLFFAWYGLFRGLWNPPWWKSTFVDLQNDKDWLFLSVSGFSQQSFKTFRTIFESWCKSTINFQQVNSFIFNPNKGAKKLLTNSEHSRVDRVKLKTDSSTIKCPKRDDHNKVIFLPIAMMKTNLQSRHWNLIKTVTS